VIEKLDSSLHVASSCAEQTLLSAPSFALLPEPGFEVSNALLAVGLVLFGLAACALLAWITDGEVLGAVVEEGFWSAVEGLCNCKRKTPAPRQGFFEVD
jgi:hypothetical protein